MFYHIFYEKLLARLVNIISMTKPRLILKQAASFLHGFESEQIVSVFWPLVEVPVFSERIIFEKAEELALPGHDNPIINASDGDELVKT